MKNKNSGLGIGIDHELREAFIAARRAEDLSAAQVLRELMSDYVMGRRGASSVRGKRIAARMVQRVG